MKKVAIVGAHGLYANYGGWDQLVNNLAEEKQNQEFEYLIFNSSQAPQKVIPPPQVIVKHINLKSSGFMGLFYDFYSILICYFKVDVIVLLGVQGIPLIALLAPFRKLQIVSNMGGIEWERPKFGFLAKQYLKFCFWLGLIYSKWVVLDNEHYFVFVPQKYRNKCKVIPYGGVIDYSLNSSEVMNEKYPFLKEEYFLSISRALVDNQIDELCSSFLGLNKKLVLISNFSSSKYGTYVLDKYKIIPNITLINGLYNKAELDLVRRSCKAYIHTHTLCGTAPSLVEMIICRKPIISFDIPQNRFSLDGQGAFFNNFTDLIEIVTTVIDYEMFIPKEKLCQRYNWKDIVDQYEKTYY
jgi:glycosyltransferase involved in cell wall biosynthesis